MLLLNLLLAHDIWISSWITQGFVTAELSYSATLWRGHGVEALQNCRTNRDCVIVEAADTLTALTPLVGGWALVAALRSRDASPSGTLGLGKQRLSRRGTKRRED